MVIKLTSEEARGILGDLDALPRYYRNLGKPKDLGYSVDLRTPYDPGSRESLALRLFEQRFGIVVTNMSLHNYRDVRVQGRAGFIWSDGSPELWGSETVTLNLVDYKNGDTAHLGLLLAKALTKRYTNGNACLRDLAGGNPCGRIRRVTDVVETYAQ